MRFCRRIVPVVVVIALMTTSCSTGLLGAGSSVTVTRDNGEWTVDPVPVQHSDAGVEIVISNGGTETFRPVLLFVVGFDTANLPRIGTELCRNGADLEFSDDRHIRCIEPEIPEEGVPFVAPDLDPGDTVSETDHSGVGLYVVLNYEDGAYEAGDYTVFEVVAEP